MIKEPPLLRVERLSQNGYERAANFVVPIDMPHRPVRRRSNCMRAFVEEVDEIMSHKSVEVLDWPDDVSTPC